VTKIIFYVYNKQVNLPTIASLISYTTKSYNPHHENYYYFLGYFLIK